MTGNIGMGEMETGGIEQRGHFSAARTLHAFATSLVDTVLPPRCPACRKGVSSAHGLCASCWRGISFITGPVCARLGIPLPMGAAPGSISAPAAADPPSYQRARAAALYDGTMKMLIHQLKYNDREDVTRLLARLLRQPHTEPLIAEADVIVPVPLARSRLVWRRFNQAATLAHDLGQGSAKPFDPLCLVRKRATTSQVGLNARQRQENVAGAFRVPEQHKPAIAGRRVLLVDDVITTGATVEAAAKALLRGGTAAVDVIALAIIPDPRRVVV